MYYVVLISATSSEAFYSVPTNESNHKAPSIKKFPPERAYSHNQSHVVNVVTLTSSPAHMPEHIWRRVSREHPRRE